MGDWPQAQETNRVVIGVESQNSCGIDLLGSGALGNSTAIWPTANRAFYVPFVVQSPFTAVHMFCLNGATISGNVDVGIYDETGNRLVSTGSTAQSGVSVIQDFDIADTLLQPGAYYMAMVCDNITATFSRYVVSAAGQAGGAGVLQQASAFALPNPATFAAFTEVFIPVLCVTGRTVV